MKNFEFVDCGSIEYGEALKKQTEAFNAIIAAKQQGNTNEAHSFLFFCEHLPVLTLGKSGKETNILVSEEWLAEQGISLYRIDRGGDITYHGPGQITVYPVFDLDCWGIGLRQYINRLEDIVIDFLSHYGIEGGRLEGATGVWTGSGSGVRKVCAIGVRSSRFVTMHGLALNINTDLDGFSIINPCGFTDRGVTSLAKEMGCVQDFATAKKVLLALFEKYFPPIPTELKPV